MTPTDTFNRAGSLNSDSEGSRWIRRLGACMLVGLFVITCLPSIWRYDVIVDETAHLQSWRNRYTGDMVSPYLVSRIEATSRLSDETRSRILNAYMSSKPLRFLVYLFTDAPGFSAIAELSRALSGSNVVALRNTSLLFMFGAAWVLYRLGTLLWDRVLGLWLSVLLFASPVVQVYAGIGRPYAMALFGTLLLVLAFINYIQRPSHSPWPVFLAALVAQSAHHAAWFVVLPFVVVAAAVRWQSTRSFATLFKDSWWYGAITLLMMLHAAFASLVTSATNNVSFGLSNIGASLGVVGPFGMLVPLGGEWWLTLALSLLALGFLVGLLTAIRCRSASPHVKFVVACGLLMCLVGAFVAGGQVRHLFIYLPLPLIVVGVGFRRLSGGGRAAIAAIAGVALAIAVLAVLRPIDGYRYVLQADARYSEIAAYLESRLTTQDLWVAMPYYYSNPLHAYGKKLPEPILPLDEARFRTIIDNRKASQIMYVYTDAGVVQQHAALRESADQRVFYRQTGNLVIVRLAGDVEFPERESHDR